MPSSLAFIPVQPPATRPTQTRYRRRMEPNPTTVDDSVSVHRAEDAGGFTLTLLWHPDAGRIGRMATVPVPRGASLDVHRNGPVFDDGEPLADTRVSRSALQVVPQPDGGARVWPGRDGLRFVLDGVQGRGGEILAPEALQRGVVLGFGRKGPLVLVQRGLRSPDPVRHGLVGPSAALAQVRGAIDLLAPRPTPVLILGPTGTGKELIARALHACSNRSDGPYVAVNLAAVTDGTAQSQLFGHRKGAFTGADRTSAGLFGDHHGGTLFLDEIGAASVDVQALLLRTLEVGEVQPVGGVPRSVDVRVVAATDEDLDEALAAGRFRRALYHRLAYGLIRIPPLCERPADVATQLVAFLRGALAAHGAADRLEAGSGWLPRDLMATVLAHAWPGNTRELRAFAEGLALHGAARSVCTLPPGFQPVRRVPPTPRGSPPLAETSLEEVLAACDYRIEAAARTLGVHRNTVRHRMAAAGLPRPMDLDADAIEAARNATGGSLIEASRQLRVSARGLRLRCSELGLAGW